MCSSDLVRPDFGRRTLAMAESVALQDFSSGQRVGAAFSADLTHIPDEIVIVADDAQWLMDDPLAPAFLQGAARTLPRHAHLVVLSRTVGAFGLAELIAQRRVALVDAEHLRFTVDDVAELARASGIDVDAAAVVAPTEGWPLAVRLALEQGSGSRTLRKDEPASIDAVLIEGLLGRLPAALGALLASLSVFETIDLAVVAHDAGWVDAGPALRELQRRGALISKVGAGEAYRIHPLLRDAILLKAENERGAATIAASHARAARAYAAAGRFSAALFHVERSSDRELALEFLRVHGRDAQRTGELPRVARIAQRHRRAGSPPDPSILYIEGLVAKSQGAASGAAALFEEATRVAQSAKDAELGFLALAESTEIALARLETIASTRIDELLMRSRALGPNARATAAVLAGWEAAARGDAVGALGHASGFTGSEDLAIRFDASVLRAYAETVLGDAASAERTLSSLLAALESSDHVVAQTLTLVWYARLALLWGETTTALDAAREATRLSADLDLRAEEGARALALAEASIHRGDAAGARDRKSVV